MDLERESPVLESVEDNDFIVVSGNHLMGSNGDCSDGHVGKGLSLGELKPEGGQSVPSGSTPKIKKGHGLRRWRRFQRGESSKERGNFVDSGKIGKRELPNATNYSTSRVVSAETKQRSGGSVSSTNAVVKSPVLAVGGFDSGLVVGPNNFSATDSENSEDRSSRSSTAASAPRWRSEMAALGGYIGDNNGIASLNRDHNLAAQRGHQGKSWTGSGKKPRGNQVKIETENSHSSMESDSQSSNFVFMQEGSSVTSKGRQSRRSSHYDGENSYDEAQGSEQRFAEELQAGFRKNMAEFEDVSQSYLPADLNCETKGVNSEKVGLSADQDPLLESITTLQSVQEALAQELLKFREIGKDNNSLINDVVQDSGPNLSQQQQCGETRQTLPSSLECEIVNLKRNVIKLESKLDDARSMLELKEGKVIELEASLNSNAPRLAENRKIVELEQKILRELKSEVESVFKQKIEAEVELLVVSRSFRGSKIAAPDKITFVEEQKTLATEQVEIVNFSENVAKRVSMSKICKFASLSFIQLVLLFVALRVFVLQLFPEYTEDVPT